MRLAQLGAWDVWSSSIRQAEGWSAPVMEAWLMAAALHHAELHDGAGEAAAVEAAAAPPEEGGLAAALAAAAAVWVAAAPTRGETASTEAVSFGGHDAAHASRLTRKTWRTASGHPRSQHAAMNGRDGAARHLFSNGLRWPGDGFGDANQTVNCRCELTYSRPGVTMRTKACPVRIKAAGTDEGTDDGVFEAIVAAYNLDSVGDKIAPGAFAETLAEWKGRGDPIPVLWSHMSADPDDHVGEVIEAEERPQGLWVTGPIDT